MVTMTLSEKWQEDPSDREGGAHRNLDHPYLLFWLENKNTSQVAKRECPPLLGGKGDQS